MLPLVFSCCFVLADFPLLHAAVDVEVLGAAGGGQLSESSVQLF